MAREERPKSVSLKKFMPSRKVVTKAEIFVLEEPEGLAKPRRDEHPSSEYQEITKGLLKRVEELYKGGKIADIGQTFLPCCFEICCVSFCCIRITIDHHMDLM